MTIISTDMYVVHLGLIFGAFAVAVPFINLVFYCILWYLLGWPYALLTFLMWIILMFLTIALG